MSFSISYEPNLPDYKFKDLLIRTGFATRIVYYRNGTVRKIPWKIGRLDRNSNLIANIRSYHEFRGPDARNIEKIIIKVDTGSVVNSKNIPERDSSVKGKLTTLSGSDLEKNLNWKHLYQTMFLWNLNHLVIFMKPVKNYYVKK